MKVLSCGMNAIKYILFIFNLFFAISGLAILIIGAVILADIGEFNDLLDGRLNASPIVFIVVGAIVFLVATFGCYGAIKESPTLLTLYAVCLAVILIIELAVGIAASVFKPQINEIAQRSLENSIRRSGRYDLELWDKVQMRFECCGVQRPSDWPDFSKREVPTSCCRKERIDPVTRDCRSLNILFQDRYYYEGCLEKFEMKINQHSNTLIGVGIGFAFIELLGIILACWLASAIRNSDNN